MTPVYTSIHRDEISFIESDLDGLAQTASSLLRHVNQAQALPISVADSLRHAHDIVQHMVNAMVCVVCHERLQMHEQRCLTCWEERYGTPMLGPDIDRAYADAAGK